MGAPVPDLNAADDSTAETLLSSLKTIGDSERRRHASVYRYWLSIRGNSKFPVIRDVDPLEISDAGRQSVLLEVIGGGENAEIRHLGSAVAAGVEVEKIGDSPTPSALTCIARNLPIVVASRDAFAFEDEFTTADGTTRCWITLLPFSATGTWIDYVYGFVSLDPAPDAGAEPEEGAPDCEEAASEPDVEQPEQAADEAAPEPDVEQPEQAADQATEAELEPEQSAEPADEAPGAEAEPVPVEQAGDADAGDSGEQSEAATAQPEAEPAVADPEVGPASGGRPRFSARFFESLASVGGFYGRVAEVETGPWTVEKVEPAAAADERASQIPEECNSTSEGPLQTKLVEVRAKADEARQAKLRSEAALIEGLSAAYDFALDAEQNAEEYLKLVEAQGLKIQLRSPMAPVVKLAFDGTCDDSTIARLEVVMAWALKQDLPRGSLAERIEAEGGIDAVVAGLNGKG